MENLTTRTCWELVKKEGHIAIWQKPSKNSCYLDRETGTQPPLCDHNDNPDQVWYDLPESPTVHFKIQKHDSFLQSTPKVLDETEEASFNQFRASVTFSGMLV